MNLWLKLFFCVAILLPGCVTQHNKPHAVPDSDSILTRSEMRAVERLVQALVGSRDDFIRRVEPTDGQMARGIPWADRYKHFEPLIQELRIEGDLAPKIAVYREEEERSGYLILDHDRKRILRVRDTPSVRVIMLTIRSEAEHSGRNPSTYSIEIGSLYVGLYNFTVNRGGSKIIYEGQTIIN